VRGSASLRVYCARDVGRLAIDGTELGSLLAITHHDKGPALGISRRWRADGRVEDLGQQRFRHRIGLEAPKRPRRVHGLEQRDFGHLNPRSLAVAS
jgi:hypothetical protein